MVWSQVPTWSPLLRVSQMSVPTLGGWAGVVPHPGDDLGGRGVPEVQMLDEVDNPGGMMRFFGILVTPLRGISKERSIPHVSRLLPVPVSWIPLEVRNKPRSENPIDWGFLTWKGEVFGQSKGCSMAVLGEHSAWLIGSYPSRGMVMLCGLMAWMRPAREILLNSKALAVLWVVSKTW